MASTTVIFVYGTLRKGFKNHALLQDTVFLGMAKTLEKYALYLAEYPCLFKEIPVSCITGEVYAVDGPTLARLDDLENHPYEYQREQVPVFLYTGERMQVWVYFHPRPEGILASCGDYASIYWHCSSERVNVTLLT